MKYKFSNNVKPCLVNVPDPSSKGVSNGYSGTISVTERSGATKISKVENRISDRFCVRTVAEVVCYTAVFSIVTQRSSPQSEEEHCVMILKTAL